MAIPHAVPDLVGVDRFVEVSGQVVRHDNCASGRGASCRPALGEFRAGEGFGIVAQALHFGVSRQDAPELAQIPRPHLVVVFRRGHKDRAGRLVGDFVVSHRGGGKYDDENG